MHSAFRSSNNISNTDDQFIIETDLGNEVFQYIYLFLKIFLIHTDP